MNKGSLAAGLALILATTGCGPSTTNLNERDFFQEVEVKKAREEKSMDEILKSPPEFSWKESRFEKKKKYFLPKNFDKENFYVNDKGFNYFVPGDRIMKYEKNEEGFHLTEINKRIGVRQTPDCPVILPVASCKEEHFLNIAYFVNCKESGCAYRVMVFDSFSPIRINPKNPALIQIMRYMAGLSVTPEVKDIDIKYEEFGIVDDTKKSWEKFIRERINFIYTKTDGIPDIIVN